MIPIRPDLIAIEFRAETGGAIRQVNALGSIVLRTTQGITRDTGKMTREASLDFKKLTDKVAATREKFKKLSENAQQGLEKLDAPKRVRRAIESAKQFLGVDVGTVDDVAQVAQEANLGLEQTADLLIDFSAATKGLGIGQAEIRRHVITIATLLKQGGSDISEVQTAFENLIQSLKDGKLDDSGFQKFLQEARLVRQALADDLQLIEPQRIFDLAEDGDLGIERFLRALDRAKPKVDKLAAESSKTISELIDSVQTEIEAKTFGTEFAQDAADIATRFVDESIEKLRQLFNEETKAEEQNTAATDSQRVNRLSKQDRLVPRPISGASNPLQEVNVEGELRRRTVEQLIPLIKRALEAIQAETGALEDNSAAAAENTAKRLNSLNVEGDGQAVRQAGIPITEEATQKLDSLTTSHSNLATQLGDTTARQTAFLDSLSELDSIAKDSLGGFIDDLRNGTSAADALENALRRIEDRLIDIALNAIFSSSGGGLFGTVLGGLGGLGGGGFGFKDGGAVGRFAGGGEVRGPGTSRSDSIPAIGPGGRPLRLSDGEFIINAEAFRRNPQLIKALNAGRAIPGFADGGPVMPNLASLNTSLRPSNRGRNDIERLLSRIADNPPQVALRNINAFDADEVVTQVLSGPAGEKAMLNMVRARPAAFRGALGV